MTWPLRRRFGRQDGREISTGSRPSWKRFISRHRRFGPPGSGDDDHKPAIRAAARSIRGNTRVRNEDCVFCAPAATLFVVADGMGGHAGGRDASRIVVETFARKLGDPDRLKDLTDAELQMLVEHTTLAARREMVRWSIAHPRCNAMGSTMVCGLIRDGRLYYANVGDSRIYRFRKGRLKLLSHDETLAQALQDAGAMSRREANASYFQHRLLNFIGVRELDHLPEVLSCDLREGDRILLATDGLTGVLSESQMAAVLCEETGTKDAVDELVNRALTNESRDNISAVLVDVGPSSLLAVPIDESPGVDCEIDFPNCLAVA